MKIMVTGHSGMFGREVVKAVKRMGHNFMWEMGPTIDPDKTKGIDITKEILVVDCCPEVVINCAGLVPQRDPAPTPAEMMRVNGYGPWNLADWCDQIGARLIQASTDCVFDGRKYQPDSDPYLEHHLPKPATPYGYSKLAGEIYREPHLTVRTSFVGRGDRGLIAELEKCTQNEEIYQASGELLWTGHTVRFVAEALVMLAEREITGLLHIPAQATFSRFQLVRLLNDTLDLKVSYGRAYEPSIDRRLGSERWAREGLPDLPSFKWQLEWLRRSQ